MDLFQFLLKIIEVFLSTASAGARAAPNSVKESTSHSFQSTLWVSASWWMEETGKGEKRYPEGMRALCVCVCVSVWVKGVMGWCGTTCPVWQRCARMRRQGANSTEAGTASLPRVPAIRGRLPAQSCAVRG